MLDLTRNLDHYLAEPFNHRVNEDLEQLGCPDVLGFFHRFYHWVELVEEGNPSEVIREIETLDYPGGLTLLIVYHLRDKLHGGFRLAGFPDQEGNAPAGSLMVIDNEYSRLEALYPPDCFPDELIDDPRSINGLARQTLWGHKVVEQVMENMINKMIMQSEHDRAIELRARQSERDRLQAELSEMMQATLAATARPKRNPEFTTNRQVIALCYLLKAAGVSANSSEQARFIEFLTNKTPKEIYKRVLAINDTVFTLEGKDAIYVRDWFQRLGLTDLAKQIDEILDRPSEKL